MSKRLYLLVIALIVVATIGGYLFSGNPETASESAPGVNMRFYTHNGERLIEFTLTSNGTSFSYTLRGEQGYSDELPEGSLIYAHDFQTGRSDYALVRVEDKEVKVIWKKSFNELVQYFGYQNGSLILVRQGNDTSETTEVYLIDASTGHERKVVISERAFQVSDVLLFNGTAYIAGASAFTGDAVLYVYNGSGLKRLVVDSAGDRLVGIKVLLDVDEWHVAFAYGLDAWDGNVTSGLCILNVENLSEVSRFGLPEGMLREVRLEWKKVVVETDREIRTYDID
ncbi:hypothetical protein A3L11_01520 [Thermococcus siculi]|uniref:Uncharacterized protein n=1 Tax=Thermococcus siculi TaxID=72803 RepID=A0A2Z2MMU9_9EURY|nr:hypothetical protein [Thermococcus siculi]ASJ07974.1 hypothetical protein A3L11_01520 [Thermococcus siculi]